MRILTFLLLTTFAFSSVTRADTIVVVGDSLSAGYGIAPELGWVNLLRERLDSVEPDRYNVINASISGDTTGGGLSRLPNIIDIQQPDTLIIELGGNDGLRGYPISTIEENLRGMILQAKENNIDVILIAIRLPPNYGTRYTSKFRGIYDELAVELNVSLVGNFIDDIGVDPSLMQSDGIHPTAEAQPLLLDNVWPTLSDHLKISP